MLLAALATIVALVTQDQAPLRAAPHESAPRQATLASGDWLEVRGERQGFVQVYDHRRERPGYVRASAVREYAVDEATAPKLGAIVELFTDAPGEESLGIGAAALYLRAAPASAVGPEVFDAIGAMGERLARRASARTVRGSDAALAGQIEAAESYGVHFARFESEGATRVCYDGEAYRRVLALPASTGVQRARAALGLTDPACVDPSIGASAGLALATWQASVLDSVDPSALAGVPTHVVARLRLRRSSVDASLAYFAARADDAATAKRAAESAKRELLLADRAALADEDRAAYDEAALRTAAVRWASESATPAHGAIDVTIAAGEPGQTCVRVKQVAKKGAAPFEHCTYALVWPSSVRVAPHDAAIVIGVQPLVGWSELLVIRPAADGWTADTITPATIDPELGYVELAGFSPDGARLLVVRESRASGPLGAPNTLAPWMQRAFQVMTTETLRVEHQAASRAPLASFRQWESPEWRRGTLALR